MSEPWPDIGHTYDVAPAVNRPAIPHVSPVDGAPPATTVGAQVQGGCAPHGEEPRSCE
jgi:hypothetical protein